MRIATKSFPAASDTLSSLKSRIGKKLELSEQQLETTVIKYEWIGVSFYRNLPKMADSGQSC